MCCGKLTGKGGDRVTRSALVVLGVLLVLGLIAVPVARVLGWSGSRASSLVAVVSQWVAAWALWDLVGSLALRSGVIQVYEPALFAALALAAGIWHYRTR